MRRLVALLVVVSLVTILAVPAAEAGAAVDVALGLASFAVFNQLIGGLFYPRPAYAYPVYYPYGVAYSAPPAYAYSAQTVFVQPPPAYSRVVQYPHGRYVLYGDGVRSPYQWVWIPSPPPPPAAPPVPPSQ
jgi:hypothetical protein